MYPDSKLLHIAFILLLLLVESVLNGNMLGLGAEGGLIQGLFIAFTIAVINVGLLGFFLGKTLRYCHHVALPKKLFAGVIPTAAIVLILIGLNFMVAHYRDVLQSVDIALDNVGIAVMDRVWSLMPPADAQSVLLFLVGLLFGILAGIDWLKMDDRYPGYGERARRQDLEEENYAEEVRETLQRLGDLHSETADILLDLKENLEHKETEFKSILSHRERKVGQFKATEAHNLSAAHQVVEKYRDSNRNARSTPAPDYFTRDLEVVTQPIETSRAGEMSIAQVESEIKRVVEKLESGITEIHESWGKAQEEFKKTHQLARERINVEG